MADALETPLFLSPSAPKAKHLAMPGSENSVNVLDAQTGKKLSSLKGHTGAVYKLAYSPDGKRLASVAQTEKPREWKAEIKVWDTTNGKELLTLDGKTIERRFGIALSRDGKWLATSDENGTVKIWDGVTGQEVFNYRGHVEEVTSLAFNPTGEQLASASKDKTVKVWDLTTGQEQFILRGHPGYVLSVAFSSDGKRLASAGGHGQNFGEVKLWEMTSGQETLTLAHSDAVLRVAFSVDSKQLAAASFDGTVRIWDASR